MTLHAFKSETQAKLLAALDPAELRRAIDAGQLTAWIAETPIGGVPGFDAVNDKPGYALCKCFYLSDGDDAEDGEISDPDQVEYEPMLDPETGLQEEEYIFHLGPNPIAGEVKILAITFFGKPLAMVNFC